ncbi:transcription initiation factor TFIID subunit 12 [Bombyx mandarina]|uniref:Transcription initiation factor TFIID subunit 12 n=2 Tax=Bombyx TaxID=7090 RepID=Q1HPY2_BOMMO|nr:transcription initiation factor TFIID subunit 12 [Bombyx mori]XP_028040120.1 transcription initiation factor TFIID subunit 12 [Bombyx mandarina]ABF51359.1 transcription initiation factor TFIID subunit 12 [Bombyx mori]
MSNNSLAQAANMPTIGTVGQGAIQYVNNPMQSPQLQNTSIQGSPSQHSPMGTQSQVAKVGQGGAGDQSSQLLSRPRLQELVREVDPTVQLDEEVEEMLLQLADDFIDTTLNSACALAKHRHAPNVELRDVQLHLERQWNMWIPGFGNDELRPYKRAAVTEAHRQRMALIRKSIKKY